MKRILRSDQHYLSRSELPAVSRKNIVFFFHIINPLLTKLVRSICLDIDLVQVCMFICGSRL